MQKRWHTECFERGCSLSLLLTPHTSSCGCCGELDFDLAVFPLQSYKQKMANWCRLVPVVALILLVSAVSFTSGQDMDVTFQLKKKWFGGFLGRLQVNFNKNASFWFFDVTFRRNVFDLRTLGAVAKVGKENHRSYRFADLPWSRIASDGDAMEILFYAKTWRRVRGLRPTITATKAYPQDRCLRCCSYGGLFYRGNINDWTTYQIKPSLLTTENYVFNDHTTIMSVSDVKPPSYGNVLPKLGESSADLVYDSYSELAGGYGAHIFITREPFHYPVPETSDYWIIFQSGGFSSTWTYLSGSTACECDSNNPL
ncbi:uncharacterized protein LOC110984554 [Acanthaster planci]|uniref:Uncharacterized protein LOC110984554 n=1 Tax=Acanthaster planci TaxID=133434 RepID=A0A8B7Z4H9_ACAPL|nr:uncharacterized protein LOC110984554 [Acanthaster planci]